MERLVGPVHFLAKGVAAVRSRLQTRPHPQLWLRLGLDKVAAEHFDHPRLWPGSASRSVQLAKLEEEWECECPTDLLLMGLLTRYRLPLSSLPTAWAVWW